MGVRPGFGSSFRHLSVRLPSHPANIAECLCTRPLASCPRSAPSAGTQGEWGGPYHRAGAKHGDSGPAPGSPVTLEVTSLLGVSEAEFCSCFTRKAKDVSCGFRVAFTAVT